MRILLVTPPMTQLNTPYPATAFLTGFLQERGHEVAQTDLALELALELFSKSGINRIAEVVLKKSKRGKTASAEFGEQREQYARAIGPVVRFLQGKDPSLAYRIIQGSFLPEGRRLRQLDPASLNWALGSQSVQDLAKHLGSLFLDEIGDVIRESVDPAFGLARYAEKLAESTPSFDSLQRALSRAAKGNGTLIDEILEELTAHTLKTQRPGLVGISVPFSGNVYGAFRTAQVIKELSGGQIRTVLGGGYVNTELRQLTEPRVFDYFDYVTLDDGEEPLLRIIESVAEGTSDPRRLLRTYFREKDRVRFIPAEESTGKNRGALPTPTYRGLRLDSYISFVEVLNPMHRLWSDGRWNKLMLAHGCYWSKCSFCDTSLDYISRYEPHAATRVVDQMERLVEETGRSGFHFVDEAAPPALLKAVAQEILRRKLVVSWWGNIRFEKTFTPELASLLARSGCIAVSGGLEAASDRVLKLMNKGVTVEQVARVTRGFADAGILVHAYLIYGFPSQTVQETVDSLERVRQLFEAGCLNSAFWHRFSVTAHSPVGRSPAQYGIRLEREPARLKTGFFARNDLVFRDPKGSTEKQKDLLGPGLEKAVFNYMQGAGFELPLGSWFKAKVPDPRVPRDEIANFLSDRAVRRH